MSHRTAVLPRTVSVARPVRRTTWRPFVHLGMVLTIPAIVLARLLVDRVGQEPVIVGIIIGTSLLAWHRVEPVEPPQDRRPGQPVRRQVAG